jgi:eukaryotic-like serine/threonine-protein kinase
VERIGNYRIEGMRGRDASGVVYEARHLVLPRRAIVKVMEELHPPRPLAIQLLREACILEALDHPGTVRVYESGLLADRRPWFAHERIDGTTVGDLMGDGPLEPETAIVMLRDIAEVLEHAHRQGVIHCGLRPDRIVLTARSRGFPLCVVDWSDARVHDTSAALPELAVRDYAAPELIGGSGVDDRVDVFALGVIAYQALTGGLPFETITASGDIQHVPTEVRCPEAPPQLTGLVDQMLAWERFDRPSSAEVFAELSQLAIDLVEPAVTPGSSVRIRKPRWTPALPHYGDAEIELMNLDLVDDVTDDQSSS